RRCKPPEDASRAAVRGRGYRLFFAPAVIAESGRVSLTTRTPNATTPIIAQLPRTTPGFSRNRGKASPRRDTSPARPVWRAPKVNTRRIAWVNSQAKGQKGGQASYGRAVRFRFLPLSGVLRP